MKATHEGAHTWGSVDRFFEETLLPHDDALEAALHASAAAGLPPHAVSPTQGKLLMMLALMNRARTILEIGTLGGYSTIWLARALPEHGTLVTLEADPKHAEVARANVDRAGVGALVDIRVGRALETLPRLAAERPRPFDLIFLDADKASAPDYFRWALQLSRRGSVIVADNVVRDGAVADAASTDASVKGVRKLLDLVGSEPRVSATAVQTVGSKGYDGFAIAMVIANP